MTRLITNKSENKGPNEDVYYIREGDEHYTSNLYVLFHNIPLNTTMSSFLCFHYCNKQTALLSVYILWAIYYIIILWAINRT
jgi:hypothetical protein